jgi:hypothetical protein
MKNKNKRDLDLVKIIAYLNCDGHLYKELKGFYLSARSRDFILDFKEAVYRKFGLKGLFELGNGEGRTVIYRVLNTEVAKFLNKNGAIKGNKVLTKFDVPQWIKRRREFSRLYLAICFFCEGHKEKRSKKSSRIAINFNKWEEISDSGMGYMQSLKEMLLKFKISTGKIGKQKGNLRKDGKITKTLRFRIKTSDTDTFIKEIGWYK